MRSVAFILLHIPKSVASFSAKYHPILVHPQKNTHLRRLHTYDATQSVFRTILCKSQLDLINAFSRYETMSVYGIRSAKVLIGHLGKI